MRTFVRTCLLVALTAWAMPAFADEPDEHLLRGDVYYLQGDYYRAITEYKTYLMKTADADHASRVDLKIAWIYHISERPEAAEALLRSIALDQRSAPEGWWARLYAAHVAAAGKEPLRARRAYEKLIQDCEPVLAQTVTDASIDREGCTEITTRARLGLAKYWANLDDFERSATELGSVPRSWNKAADARKVANYVATIQIPQKSPAVAGALSVVPGLGHFYLEQWGTGIVAMVWNGAFIFATVDSFAAGRIGQGTLLGLLELVWYGGTIFGAISGAHRFNRDARLIVRDGLIEDIDRLAVDTPWPARFPAQSTPLQLHWDW